MRLAALTTGAGVPEGDFAGRVRHVFRRALILDTEAHGLVTLAPAEAGGLPAGIGIDLPADFAFSDFAQSSQETAARARILRIAGSGLAIDLAGAVPWRARLDRLTLSLAESPSLAAFERAAALLRADGRAGALLALASPPILALANAIRRRDGDAAGRAAEGLIGLGAGGTPAGDDFLVGILAALHAGGRDAAGLARALGAAIVTDVEARTNAVSATYLRAATTGEVSERLADLATAIARGDDATPAAAAAIAVGHTSGADGVLGLLVGASALAPDDRLVGQLLERD